MRSVSPLLPALAMGFCLLVAGPARAGDLEPIRKDSGFAWAEGDDEVPHTVERKKVKKGVRRPGDIRDAVPPIDEPTYYASFAAAESAKGGLELRDEDRVLGLAVRGDARAYPTRILDRHEIVNDTVGGRAIAVVW